MRKIMLALCLSFSVMGVAAKDFGTLGQSFEIAEPDLLETITFKLKAFDKGSLEAHNLKIQARIKEQIRHPKPVPGLVKTTKPRVFYYDPSLKVPYDLKDHQAQVFAKAGTVINPLATHPLKIPLLFIAGDDPKQLAFAKAEAKAKIILVSGSPLALMEQHRIRLYFDQGGALVRKWGIHQVPARVTQDHERLKIEELELAEATRKSVGESP